MTKPQNNNIPDLRYPIYAPSGLGYRDEFHGVAFLNAMQAQAKNANMWRFVHDEVSFHGFAHLLMYAAAVCHLESEWAKRMVYAPTYQGDMSVEIFIVAIEKFLEHIHKGKTEGRDVEEFARMLASATIKVGDSERVCSLGSEGNKAAFILGDMSDPKRSIFDIKSDESFEDSALKDQVESFLGKNIAMARKYNCTKAGDSFIAADGQRQYYFDVKLMDSNDDVITIVQSLAGAIDCLRHHLEGENASNPQSVVLSGIKMAEVFQAMEQSSGKSIPSHLRIGLGLGAPQETVVSVPAAE